MGQQHRKTTKRTRRKEYLRRKLQRLKLQGKKDDTSTKKVSKKAAKPTPEATES